MTIKCSGCGIEYQIDESVYRNRKKWGKNKFYHNNECRLKNMKRERMPL